MAKKTRVYKAQDILIRVRANLRELIALEKEIALYLAEVERRRADNRSSIEQAIKLDLDLYGRKH